MNNTFPPSSSLVRIKQVAIRIGVSRSTIYKWIEQGYFPRPIQLGPRAVAWSRDVIDEWIASRPCAKCL